MWRTIWYDTDKRIERDDTTGNQRTTWASTTAQAAYSMSETLPAIQARQQQIESTLSGLASTTAADITEAGLSATFGVFFPEAYGAKGDGVTNDTAAIQAAIDAIRAAGGGTLQLAPKTYVVARLDVQAGLTILGYGATLLRPAASPNGTITITNTLRRHVGDADSTKPITVKGLTIDGNLANQGDYAAYQLSGAYLAYFAGRATHAGREAILLEDVTTKNSPTDGFHFGVNVTATMRNCAGVDCFRGGIVCSGGNSSVSINGYSGSGAVCGSHADVEIDSDGYGASRRCDITMRDATFLGSPTNTLPVQFSARAGSRIIVENVRSDVGVYVSGGSADHGSGVMRFRYCHFETYGNSSGNRNTIANPVDVSFERCTFSSNTGTNPAAVYAAFINYNTAGTGVGLCNLRMTDCDFEVRSTQPGDTLTAIYSETCDPIAYGGLTLRGGSIAAAFAIGVHVPLGGKVDLDGAVSIAATTALNLTHGIASYGRPVVLKVGALTLGATCTTYMAWQNAHATCVVTHDGTVMDEARNAITAPLGLANTYAGGRTVNVSADPTAVATAGLTGDVARLKVPVAGQPYQWVCTAASASTATWKALTAVAA